MKNSNLLWGIGLFSAILILISCGKDGEDGNAYVTYSWDSFVDGYSDTNPQTPDSLTQEMEYSVTPGSYSFEYNFSDGIGNFWEYSGTYTISIVKGEEGKGFKDGENGRDRLYEFILTGTGFVSSYGPRSSEPEKEMKQFLKASERFDHTEKSPVGDEQIDVFQSGNLQIVVTKQCYRIAN